MEPLATITEDSDFPVFRKLRGEAIEDGFVREDLLGSLAGDERYMALLAGDERYMALYFLKRTKSDRFGDSPVMGATSYKVRDLVVEGPYNAPKKSGNEEIGNQSITIKAIKKFVPFSQLPVPIYSLSEITYGLDGRLEFAKKEELEALNELKEAVKKKIKQIASAVNETDSRLVALVNGSLVTYDFYHDPFWRDQTLVSVLGRDKEGIDKILAATEIIGLLREWNSSMHYRFSSECLTDSKKQFLSLGELPISLSDGGIGGFFNKYRKQIVF